MSELRLDPNGQPLLKIAQQRVGLLRASKVGAFMVQWQMARAEVPGFDGLQVSHQVEAYRANWRVPERTAWRELAQFRECFPEEDTPSRLMDLAMQKRQQVGALRLAVA